MLMDNKVFKFDIIQQIPCQRSSYDTRKSPIAGHRFTGAFRRTYGVHAKRETQIAHRKYKAEKGG